jgi:CO/xanthine dehydrogenase Mo-binding subunit
VTVRAAEDGCAEVLVSSTEIGQGTETVFCQIVAEALDMQIERVRFVQPQTSRVPNSGPTVASRTCTIVGNLVQRAALELKESLGGHTVAEHVALHGPREVTTQYRPREGVFWDDEAYKGSAYGAYSWMVTVAEVTVCPVTAAIKVDALTATVDIGRVIHPVLAIGQVEGAVAQAAGWATTEHVVLKEGRMANGHMTNYIIPTSVDAPEIKVEFFERPYDDGGYGAKGVGELPMDGPGPAIAAAVRMATGCPITSIPILPEFLMTEIDARENSQS